ncbi:MAG: tetratricopeptide repeat protein [Magnetospirillum sp.]|nr:tetratricopeptide repeat protein [Magnetospirillum sp.]
MRPSSPTAAALALLAAIAAGAPAVRASQADDAKRYENCMAMARSKPDEGLEEALAWQSLGGGEPAEDCAAVALIGQGKYTDAAARLEKLAAASKQGADIRAGMLQQAAQAWLMAGKTERADAVQRTALTLAPGNVEILLDHALTMAEVHHYKEAVDDLTQVVSKQPDRVEAYTMRASAYRYLNNTAAAQADVDRALTLDPGSPSALVERGILRRLKGDNAGAREDWLKVVETVPGGPALDDARKNLELLDVNTKQ